MTLNTTAAFQGIPHAITLCCTPPHEAAKQLTPAQMHKKYRTPLAIVFLVHRLLPPFWIIPSSWQSPLSFELYPLEPIFQIERQMEGICVYMYTYMCMCSLLKIHFYFQRCTMILRMKKTPPHQNPEVSKLIRLSGKRKQLMTCHVCKGLSNNHPIEC